MRYIRGRDVLDILGLKRFLVFMNHALIVCKRKQTRGRLRQLLQHVQAFGDVTAVDDLHDARDAISMSPRYNYVFVGSEYGQNETAQFLEKTRGRRRSRNKRTFVLLFEPGEENHENLANNMMVGFHGFLCEPFTLEAVAEIASLANKVSRQQTVLRLKAATGLLLTDLRDDEEEKTEEGASPKNLWDKVQDSCSWYNQVTSESLTLAVQSKLHKMPATARAKGFMTLRDRVAGVSKRVRLFFKKEIPGIGSRHPRKKKQR